MNGKSFLPEPVRLSQHTEGSSHPSSLTRRSFVKRTGGATVATLIAWNLGVKQARAEEDGGASGSGSYEWKLLCVADPTVVGASSTEHGNNGGAHPSREWYYRNQATWDGGDDAVCMEIKGTGPVKCDKDVQGEYVIDDSKVRTSFTVSGSIKGYINNDANDGDGYWQGVFDGVVGSDDNQSDDLIAYDSDTFPEAVLSINTKTGKVSFTPQPLVFTPIQAACAYDLLDDADFANMAFQLVGGGGITPAIQVVGGAARANIDDVTWEVGFEAEAGVQPGEGGGPGGSVGFNYKMTFKNLPVTTQRTLSWNFIKVRRKVNDDGSKGPWEQQGLAWPDSFTGASLPPPYKP